MPYHHSRDRRTDEGVIEQCRWTKENRKRVAQKIKEIQKILEDNSSSEP